MERPVGIAEKEKPNVSKIPIKDESDNGNPKRNKFLPQERNRAECKGDDNRRTEHALKMHL